MYSTKKIPAPFHQPNQRNSRKEKKAGGPPASPVKTELSREESLPVITAKEKTTQKKAVPQTVSPFLALAFLELFSNNKEG